MERKEFLLNNPTEVHKEDLHLFGKFQGGEIEFIEDYFEVVVNYLNENYQAWNIRKYGNTYLARIT